MHEHQRTHDAAPTAQERDTQLRAPRPTPVVRRRTLMVGSADDPAEHAADRLADAAVNSRALFDSPGGYRIQASGAPSRPTGEGTARRASIGAEGGELDGETSRAIDAARGGGAALAGPVRDHLESTMGADLSGVRLHAGARAAEMNSQMQASAFTLGNDVFFRDGMPDTGTRGGMHLLAHEVAHTVQQRGGARRRMVRRKLIPKALNAFNAAEAANASFSKGRKDTDELAAEADQEDLSRVHGRMHTGQDSADAQKVAHFVRAVVLGEYSSRLRSLETAVDKDGNPLSARGKAAKKTVYKTKAEEFRQKHVPLVAKGSTAPETQGFLRQYGFAAAFGPNPSIAPVAQAAARIDVRSTFIGGPILGVRVRAHLFIVYTAKDGRQMYFRGGPDNDDFTVADMGDYVPGVTDWDPSAPSVTLVEGPAAEAKLDALIEATSVIDGMKVPYVGAIAKEFGGNNPNAVESLLSQAAMATSSEGENCNATAWTILTRAGISKKKKPSGRHPGWGSILGSKTAGKENALPPKEAQVGKPYIVDDAKDMVDDTGAVKVYRDRALFETMTKVPVGTKVMLYQETSRWRRVLVDGTVAYIPRRAADAVYDLLPGWIMAVQDEFADDELQKVLDDPANQDNLRAVSRATGIPRAYVVQAVQAALNKDGQVQAIVWYRIEQLGKARARELLDKPAELERMANNTGLAVDDLADIVEKIVGDIEAEAAVPATLLKHLNDPNAANMAMNEAPDYTTMHNIAVELKRPLAWVVPLVEQLRPPANRNNLLEQLLAADLVAQGELPDIADYVLRDWATRTGVAVDFLKQQCVKIDLANKAHIAQLQAEAAAKAQAEAAAKEKAERRARAKARKEKRAKKAERAKGKAGQGKAPQVPKPTGPVVTQPKLSEDETRKVFLAIVTLAWSDQQVWEQINTFPLSDDLRGVATDNFVSAQDVIDVGVFYFQSHKGTTTLITFLKQWSEQEARDFAAGRSSEAEYQKVVAAVGLPRDQLVASVAAWVSDHYG